MDRNTYRGKRVDNGEWVYGSLVQSHHFINNGRAYICPVVSGADMTTGQMFLGAFEEIDPATLGQCTGLRDKTGRDIFEGDIVKATAQDSHDGNYEETLWVQWVDEVCGFVGLCETSRRDEFYVSLMGYDSLEVIGNVHDTPELLKGVRG